MKIIDRRSSIMPKSVEKESAEKNVTNEEKLLEDLRLKIQIALSGLQELFDQRQVQELVDRLKGEKDTAELEFIKDLLNRTSLASKIYQTARRESLGEKIGTYPEAQSVAEKSIKSDLQMISESALDFIDAAKKYFTEKNTRRDEAEKAWRQLEYASNGDVDLVKKKVRFLSRQREGGRKLSDLVGVAAQDERERRERERLEREAREEAERLERVAEEQRQAELTRQARQTPPAPPATAPVVESPRPAQTRRPRPAREPINPENLPAETSYVENATNPLKEALNDGGIEAPERESVIWNLIEKYGQDVAIYKNRGLELWAEALSDLEEKLRNISPEKRQIIEAEIREGAIPIIIPGKRVQLETTLEKIKKLRPKFKKENEEIRSAGESYLEWDHLKNLIQSRNELLVSDIPDEPYILLTKPTQKSELRNKTVEQQKQAILDITAERSGNNRAPVFAMNLHEYAAVQTVFSEMLEQRNTNEILELTKMRPLDFGAETWTRFVSLPVEAGASVSGGLVPFGFWYSYSGQLFLDKGVTNAYGRAGVRLSVRILI